VFSPQQNCAESRKHAVTAKLRKIPSLGAIRSALAVALIQAPHRFPSKRQLWTYSGLGLETRDSGEYHYVRGQEERPTAIEHELELGQRGESKPAHQEAHELTNTSKNRGKA